MIDQYSDDDFEKITAAEQWGAMALKMIDCDHFSEDFKIRFHDYWTYIGHRIREQLKNDDLLCQMLKICLPEYHGSDLVLYRGENFSRWKNKEVGFFWSEKMDVAEMFGMGLNSVGVGGVLLKCFVKKEFIISGRSRHGDYLDESAFTVNPFDIRDSVKIIEKYPPVL